MIQNEPKEIRVRTRQPRNKLFQTPDSKLQTELRACENVKMFCLLQVLSMQPVSSLF